MNMGMGMNNMNMGMGMNNMNMGMGMNNMNMGMPMQQNAFPQNTVNVPVQVQEPEKVVEKASDDPDYNILNSLEDDSSKRDYLGEFIFKKIESHPFTENTQMSMDQQGKITGMILGIEEVSEIVDIIKNYDLLTSRIIEAWTLLKNSSSA